MIISGDATARIVGGCKVEICRCDFYSTFMLVLFFSLEIKFRETLLTFLLRYFSELYTVDFEGLPVFVGAYLIESRVIVFLLLGKLLFINCFC